VDAVGIEHVEEPSFFHPHPGMHSSHSTLLQSVHLSLLRRLGRARGVEACGWPKGIKVRQGYG
jgi:hypothetical protein